MAMQWNRATRREVSKRGDRYVNEIWAREMEKMQQSVYRMAVSSVLLACHTVYGFDKVKLQYVAAESVKLHNNALCAEELIQDLKDRTGFDANQPTEEYEYEGEA